MKIKTIICLGLAALASTFVGFSSRTVKVNATGELAISSFGTDSGSSYMSVTEDVEKDYAAQTPSGIVKFSYTQGSWHYFKINLENLTSDYTKMDINFETTSKDLSCNYNPINYAIRINDTSSYFDCRKDGETSGNIYRVGVDISLATAAVDGADCFLNFYFDGGEASRANSVVVKYLRFYNGDESLSKEFGVKDTSLFIGRNFAEYRTSALEKQFTSLSNNLDDALVQISYTDSRPKDDYIYVPVYNVPSTSNKMSIEFEKTEDNPVNFAIYDRSDCILWNADKTSGQVFSMARALSADAELRLYIDRLGSDGAARANTIKITSITFYNGAEITAKFTNKAIVYNEPLGADVSSFQTRYDSAFGYTFPSQTDGAGNSLAWYTEPGFENQILSIPAESSDPIELYGKWIKTEVYNFTKLETRFSLGIDYTFDDPGYTINGVKMRYGVLMDGSLYASLVALGEVTFGAELTKGATVRYATASEIAQVGDDYQYAIVLKNIPAGNYATEITGRCYVEYSGVKYYCGAKTYSAKSAAQYYIDNYSTDPAVSTHLGALGALAA